VGLCFVHFSILVIFFSDGDCSRSLFKVLWPHTHLVSSSLFDMADNFDTEVPESSSKGQRRRQRNASRPTSSEAPTPSMTKVERATKREKQTFQTKFSAKIKAKVDALEEIVLETKWRRAD
jgi:hypothetical protein